MMAMSARAVLLVAVLSGCGRSTGHGAAPIQTPPEPRVSSAPAVTATAAPAPLPSEPVVVIPTTKPLAELKGERVEQGPSRADACKPEIVARGFHKPGLFVAGDTVFVVDTKTTKIGSNYEHRMRAVELRPGNKSRPVVDFVVELYDVAMVGSRLVVLDAYEKTATWVDVKTGKREPVKAPFRAIGVKGSTLYGVTTTDTHAEVRSIPGTASEASNLLAKIEGKLDSPTSLVSTAENLYFFADALGETEPVKKNASRLIKVPAAGGEGGVIGMQLLATHLAATSDAVFVGSLTELFRIDDKSGAIARAGTLGGVSAIAADDAVAAWTDFDNGTISLWPHGGAPYLACKVPFAGHIALTKTHVYFTAATSDALVSDGKTHVARFPR